ncbi:hypothetical protein [Leifsonia sp. Leaf264]|uniref:hypothetical protein n=1 Tax=Leifsonia sp. Leaf264 TaxID=1736314 RepID=UPI0006F9DA45|nr:hypothetical protein [Leifsonia sp. Leaf264]KQO98186.1 hypothetical protein ASF30_08995 [Leifsonia sp. Leaf264]
MSAFDEYDDEGFTAPGTVSVDASLDRIEEFANQAPPFAPEPEVPSVPVAVTSPAAPAPMPQILEQESPATVSASIAVHTEDAFASDGSQKDRALQLLADGAQFNQSEAKRAAALVRATLAHVEAIDRQTEVQAAHLAALLLQNQLMERMLAETRMGNQLAFFQMGVSDFELKKAPELEAAPDGTPREHPHTQMKRNLGILPAAKIATEPERAESDGADAAPEDQDPVSDADRF